MADGKEKPANGGKVVKPNPKERTGRPGSSLPGARDRSLNTKQDKGVTRR